MSNITAVLDQSYAGFNKIAQRHQLVQWAEESQFALQAYQKNPKLQECSADSIQNAIINVAAVGLTLNPAHQYAYLVPEYSKSLEGNECQLRISFKGLIKIATDTGVIDWVAADVVKKNDVFIFKGKWEKPVHEMDPFSEDRGPSKGVYCVIKMPDGQILTETAPWSEVMKAKAAAKTKLVWDKWEDEMAKKFIIKRASKQWPKTDASERLNEAVHVMNQTEGSEDLLGKLDQVAGYIIQHLSEQPEGYKELVYEAYSELSDAEKSTLWTAKTKGGWLTMDEKREIRDISFEFAEYRKNREAIEDQSDAAA